MPIVLNGTTGITTPTYNGSTTAEYLVPVTGFKNRIINGDMTIDQRNAGASVTNAVSSTGVYTLDRWDYYATSATKFTIQQNAGSVTPPTGFTNYLGVTSSTATSLGASDYYLISQKVEGYNMADLAWGSADAKTVTLSFWVRSSLTGTFGGCVRNGVQNYYYPFSYTISAANTWEQKTISIIAPTSSTFSSGNSTTNGIGLEVMLGLGVGSTFSGTAGAWSGSAFLSATGATSVVGTNGATFYITGVQLEKGSNATSFDYLPYGTELALCQRYYQRNNAGSGAYTGFGAGVIVGTGQGNVYIKYATTMRTTPTLTQSNCAISDGTGNYAISSIVNFLAGPDSGLSVFNFTGTSANYRGAYFSANNNTSAYFDLTAEL